MILRLSALQRRKDLTQEQFSRHWCEVHGPLVQAAPGVLRYRQNHVVESSQMVRHSRGPAEVDGFAQLWFNDAAAMKEASASPQFQAAWADLPAFAGAMTQFEVETNHVMERSLTGKGVKRMTLLYAQPGVDIDTFRVRWFDEHAPLVAAFPGLRGYLQHLVTGTYEFPKGAVVEAGIRCAGILEMWFETREAMDAAFLSPEAKATIDHGDLFLAAATTYMVDEVALIG